MGSIKGYKKKSEKREGKLWPRKYVPQHTEGKCPNCRKNCDNLEAHMHDKHLGEKPLKIKGEKHGH